MRAFLLLMTLVFPLGALASSGAPPPKPTEANLTANALTKSYAKKISSKAQEMAHELRTGVRTDERATLEEFIAWLKAEVADAVDVSADWSKLVASAKVVFSAACSHDEKAYRKAWAQFLAITLKYSAFVACSFVDPYVLPPLCFVAGSIIGKVAGDKIGELIHNSCGRETPLRELQRESEEIIDSIDIYDTDEYKELVKAIGY